MAQFDTDDDDIEGTTPDERIVNEAKKRWKRCEEWESTARKRFLDDRKFANGDSYNFWQWPGQIRQNRDIDQKPCLTINKTRQHNLQIINDARQNKPGIKIRPVGNEASFESAQAYQAVIDHIEYISNAQAAYDTATRFQVEAGIGYWRVVTDYCGDDTFDQEIFIRRITDPLTIYMDPGIKEADGSDARFAFVFDEMSRDEFDVAYPDYKDVVTQDPLNADDTWVQEDSVRVAEYWRRTEKKDRLIAMTDPMTGQQTVRRVSKIPKELLELVQDNPSSQFREIVENQVERFLIIGNEIAEKNVWAGCYIPIVRVIGEETVVEGQLDRKGHTRALIDPQRIYNYNSSSFVEVTALQPKMPWVGPAAAFESYEDYWATANVANYAFLPFNHIDEKGMPVPPPTRMAPPVMSEALMKGLEITSDEMRSVSGQYQAELGMPSNERSGVAINARQRQGENATYHYIDHLAIAIRFTGKILIDLIPKIYDTPRVIKMMAEDGVERSITIDPNADIGYLKQQQANKDQVKEIFNPNVGKYDVLAEVGPNFATRRQEAFNAFTQIAAANPEFMQVGGDLMFRAADFPMAEELAQRWKRTIPPNILGEGADPRLMQMQQALQQTQNLLQNATEALADEKRKKQAEQQRANADSYRAETDRFKAFADHGIDMKGFALEVAQLIFDMQQTHITNQRQAEQDALAAQNPQQQAAE